LANIKSWASPDANLLPEQGGASEREDVAEPATKRVSHKSVCLTNVGPF
jgi:hypothetical protein